MKEIICCHTKLSIDKTIILYKVIVAEPVLAFQLSIPIVCYWEANLTNEALLKRKLGILTAVDSMELSAEAVYPIYLAASIDSREEKDF
ncbi:hypothetical protein Dimus_011857 [Dionaea muscipula]